MQDIRLMERLAVHDHSAAPEFHLLARQPDDALELEVAGTGAQSHDVSALRVP